MTHAAPQSRGLWRGAWLGVILLGAILRIAGAAGELWVDEIWSFETARGAGSIPELFQRRSDNNHLINSAWLLAFGPGCHPLAYRGATLLAGIASLFLVAAIARETGRHEALVAVLLFGTSYPFVLYGSEARGYSQVVFFALLGYWLLRRHLRTPSWWSAGAFSLCGILGLLSHLSYAHFSIAAVLWSGIVWIRSGRGFGQVGLEFVRCHAVPAVAAGVLYLTFARGMAIVGGPKYTLVYALARSAALLQGLPEDPYWSAYALLLAIALTATSLLSIALRHGCEALGLGLLGCVSPLVVVAVFRPELLFPRYFLVSFTFVLLAWSQWLGGWIRAAGARRVFSLAILTGWVCLHIPTDLELARRGRSKFGAVLRQAIRETSATEVLIGVDRNPIADAMLRFHAPPPTPGKSVRYLSDEEFPDSGVHGIVVLGFVPHHRVPPELVDRHGNRYELVEFQPVALESGLPTYRYRRASGG